LSRLRHEKSRHSENRTRVGGFVARNANRLTTTTTVNSSLGASSTKSAFALKANWKEKPEERAVHCSYRRAENNQVFVAYSSSAAVDGTRRTQNWLTDCLLSSKARPHHVEVLHGESVQFLLRPENLARVRLSNQKLGASSVHHEFPICCLRVTFYLRNENAGCEFSA